MVWALIVLAAVVVYQVGALVLLTVVWRNTRASPRRTPDELGLSFTEVWVPTRRARRLHGWWVPAGDGRQPAVVLVHGWGRNVERALPYIEMLHPAGFGLLGFDARHHGASDPDGHASMKKFSEDIRAAIEFLAHRRDVDPERIAVVGLSIGGSAAIHAAAIDPRIRAVIVVGSFAHPRDAILHTGFGSLFLAPAMPLAFRFIEWRIGARFDRLAPERNVGRIAGQLLLVHGEEDRTVPVEHLERLRRAALGRAQAWRISGRGHSDCHLEPGFATRLRRFLCDSLDWHENSNSKAGAASGWLRPSDSTHVRSDQLQP